MTDVSAVPESLTPRYDFKEIDLDSGSSHADVVTLVGEGVRVLELGPATGYMSRALADRGCEVVGIEIDPGMAEQAAHFCERMIVGDIDSLDLEQELGDDRFDVIVAADVLEHLRDPLRALVRLREFLKPDGYLVISIPNVAHGSVRLALLGGHFDYSNSGLLDSTHLRFFTRETFEKLLDEAELGLAELHRHDLNLDASEVPFDPDSVPAGMREALEHDPDSRAYQFVFKAVPMRREGLREIQARLRELQGLRARAEQAERRAEETEERVEELEQALAAVGGREGELRRALIEAHDQLLRRDNELESVRASADASAAKGEKEIATVNAELVAARVGLDRIRQSLPFRIYGVLHSAPGIRTIRRRREAKFKAEVAKRSGQST
jgi:2-polyprenyl-3-methyl-5-hydroxy-6-metoxy-1,4-benzoquinol methylase